MLVTVIELALLFFALSPRRRFVPSRSDVPTSIEHVVFVVPAPSAVTEHAPARNHAAVPTAPAFPEAVASTPTTTPTPLRDSATATVGLPRSLPPRPATGAPGEAAIGPVLAPRGFNPSSLLTRRVIDSVLDSLNANMPALIWARIPTQAERDAAYQEGVLAMRLSGRALLVPADPHLAPGVQLPSFFSRKKQRVAARRYTDSVLAENMERLARLRARAQRDSLRRDSLQRADSLRRADTLHSATPRRRPDARTPA